MAEQGSKAGGPTGAAAPLSLRAYARHRGVSAPAVLKAVASGRLKASLVRDEQGHAKVADVALADREWTAATDITKAPLAVKARAAAAARVNSSSPAPPPPATPAAEVASAEVASADDDNESESGFQGTLSLSDALAQEKTWKARLAELDYKQRSGELVDAADVEARIVEDYGQCRTKLLGLARKAKSALPHLTHTDVLALDALVREALEQLAVVPDDGQGPA